MAGSYRQQRDSFPERNTGTRADREAFWVDKEGIPHWDGMDMTFMKQYKQRVRLEYEAIIGDNDWANSQRATLGLRLTRGLSGRAWDAVESLLEDLTKLKTEGGHKLVITALEKLDKAEVLRKQNKFDEFFKRSLRRHGQEMQEYVRQFERRYSDMTALDNNTRISDDLYAYFLLENARLQESQKKLVTLVADSEFETKAFVRCLTTNFHDLHLTERRTAPPPKPFRGGGHKGGKGGGRGGDRAHWTEDQDEADAHEYEEEADEVSEESDGGEDVDEDADAAELSDNGASQDESIAEAHAAYDAARKQLRQQQRDRGFIRRDDRASGGVAAHADDRKAALAEQKKKSRCGACGEIGHWAGDPQCKKAKRKPGKGGSRGGGARSSGGRKPRRQQAYFTIEDGDEVFELEDVLMMETDDSWEIFEGPSTQQQSECEHKQWNRYGNQHAEWWNCRKCGLRMKTQKKEEKSEQKDKKDKKEKDDKSAPKDKKEKKRYEKKPLAEDCKHTEEVRFENQFAQWWNCAQCKGRLRTQKHGGAVLWEFGAPQSRPSTSTREAAAGAASSSSGAAPAGAVPKQL